MVFGKTKAPRIKEKFMAWYEKLTEWDEDHSYTNNGKLYFFYHLLC